jgi:hypothetical protein
VKYAIFNVYILFCKKRLMSGFLETAVQNSQGDESIKAQTLRILQEAKEIRESV